MDMNWNNTLKNITDLVRSYCPYFKLNIILFQINLNKK